MIRSEVQYDSRARPEPSDPLVIPGKGIRGASIEQFTHFTNTINGAPRGANGSSHGVDPSTRERLWEVPLASQKDADAAVSASKAAFASWSSTQWSHRQQLLLAARDILLENKVNMATLLTKEGGKPVRLTASGSKISELICQLDPIRPHGS